MRERCKAWCTERLHAAAVGIGSERHGFGGSSCGEDLTLELLYDCGYSHEDVLASITAEAVRSGGGHASMHTVTLSSAFGLASQNFIESAFKVGFTYQILLNQRLGFRVVESAFKEITNMAIS